MIKKIANQKQVFQVKLGKLRGDPDPKSKYRVIFWNLIYYFNEHTLPFDCILPYEFTEFQESFEEYNKLNRK